MNTAFAHAKRLSEEDRHLTAYPALKATVERLFTLDADTIS